MIQSEDKEQQTGKHQTTIPVNLMDISEKEHD